MTHQHMQAAGRIGHHLACPVCRTALPPLLAETAELRCRSCRASFTSGTHSFDFTPPAAFRDESAIWQAWDHVQANGFTSYSADPDRNLSVGRRDDCEAFRAFASCSGLVLDVGCGPQEWPAYYQRSEAVTYIGIDPFADVRRAEFLRFIGLAEFLPFVPNVFEHVLFATTLDHFVDPVLALAEARRVLKHDGAIAVWLGEKDASAPKPAVSADWYDRLERPELADDVFHIKRMSARDFASLAESAGLAIDQHETHRIDLYRVNHFFRVRPK